MPEVTVTRTLKIPVHYLTTQRKLSVIDRLTARLTYAVRLFNRHIINEVSKGGFPPRTRKDVRRYSEEVAEATGLSAGHIQQCEDKVLWAWRQYARAHRKWEWILSRAKDGTKWKEKLLKREPSYPFVSKRSRLKKIPVWIDGRTGRIEKTGIKLTDTVAHISTLKKGETIDVPLNPSPYHRRMLDEAEKVKSFEIIYDLRRKRFMLHILCEYQVPESESKGYAGADLGIKRPISAVLIGETGFHGFRTLDNGKANALQELNDRTSHLRRKEKWEVLKKLREKRSNVADHHDRMAAKEFAETTQGYHAFTGDPEYIRYHKFKGNKDPWGRRRLQGWSFARQAGYIEHEKSKLGDCAETLNEWGTSSRCYKCGGKMQRPYDGSWQRCRCTACGSRFDTEFNSGMNIVALGMSRFCDKPGEPFTWQNPAGATVDMAQDGG